MQSRLLVLATGLFLASCATVLPIGRINADPSRYQNRPVRIEGSVTNSFGALGTGGYQIDDGTGKIFVVSEGSGVPSKGARVAVKGIVMNGVTVMGKSYGTAIRESNHKAY